MTRRGIDRERVRVALRRWSRGNLLVIAERATELVPRPKLRTLVGDFVRLDELAEPESGAAPLLDEGLAEPAGVLVSGAVHDQVRDRLDLAFEDLGERELKNLARPVRIYRVRSPAESKAALAPSDAYGGSAARAPVGKATEAPSIAVLPFANLSNDPDQEYFADGMVEDIITARFTWLAVIARNSTFTYKGRAVDVRQVATELRVRYVLEGSVRKVARRVRITGQLIDATTGAHLWAERFDGDLEDVFDLQDRITEGVVGAIEPRIRKAEIERSRRQRPESLDAYDLYLRALPHVYAMRPDDNREALQVLEQAISLDPGFASALAYAAWCYEQRVVRGWPTAREGDVENDVKLARAATKGGWRLCLTVCAGPGCRSHNPDFGKVLPVFASRRRVIALEEQAHGRTTDRNAPVAFQSSADDVAALLRYLKVDKADIFGFSNGASVALQVAIRHPPLARKVV